MYLGAFVTMAAAADHPDIRQNYPVVAQSLDLAASPQIRNMATLGGNVCSGPGAIIFAIRHGASATSASRGAAAPHLLG